MAVTINSHRKKTESSTMEINRLHTLAREIFKTLNNLNPNFIKKIFYISSHSTRRRYDIFVQSQEATKMVIKVSGLWVHIYGTYCQKKLNLEPQSIFKDFIKTWFGPECRCKLCSI